MTSKNLESFDGEEIWKALMGKIVFQWLLFYMGKISWTNFH
jgi:hypothetical protein